MKDIFSKQSELYARYRPTYPPELFTFILNQVPERNMAWDCATGNGQTAKDLAPYFKKVMATDISEKQLSNALSISNVFYSVQAAEKTDFEDDSFDLVTVSQALHWFDFDLFYKELNRVTRNNGWFATWMYGGMIVSPQIDDIKQDFHKNILGPYWDPERKLVDTNYATIPFPLKEISCPIFSLSFEWGLEDIGGYLNSWSAVQKFILDKGYNPTVEIVEKIRKHWVKEKMTIRFPLYLRMGQVLK